LTTARGIPTLLNGAEEDHVQAVGRVRALRLFKVRVLVAAEVLFAMKCAAENDVHVVTYRIIDYVFIDDFTYELPLLS
jgi:hypothetical protein